MLGKLLGSEAIPFPEKTVLYLRCPLPPSPPGISYLKHESSLFRSFIQPCMWFKEEPSQFFMDLTAQSLTCSIMERPHTGLDECPRILLLCFRAMHSAAEPVRHARNAHMPLKCNLRIRREMATNAAKCEIVVPSTAVKCALFKKTVQ